MSRKVFISVLGTGRYQPVEYGYENRKGEICKSKDTKFIQRATMEMLVKEAEEGNEWTEKDVAYILMTEDAEKCNWKQGGQNAPDYVALEKELKETALPMKVEPVKQLPDGNNNDEIWQIFDKVYGLINDGDILYFDMTHGFRYLPMLIMTLCNYAKFIKKDVKIKAVTYGNIEIKKRRSENNGYDATDRVAGLDKRSVTVYRQWQSGEIGGIV